MGVRAKRRVKVLEAMLFGDSARCLDCWGEFKSERGLLQHAKWVSSLDPRKRKQVHPRTWRQRWV